MVLYVGGPASILLFAPGVSRLFSANTGPILTTVTRPSISGMRPIGASLIIEPSSIAVVSVCTTLSPFKCRVAQT